MYEINIFIITVINYHSVYIKVGSCKQPIGCSKQKAKKNSFTISCKYNFKYTMLLFIIK